MLFKEENLEKLEPCRNTEKHIKYEYNIYVLNNEAKQKLIEAMIDTLPKTCHDLSKEVKELVAKQATAECTKNYKASKDKFDRTQVKVDLTSNPKAHVNIESSDNTYTDSNLVYNG